jgi:hypothetical protein
MIRTVSPQVFFSVLSLCLCASVVSSARADAFDNYTNPVLAKVPGSAGVLEIKKLTSEMIAEHDRVLPGASAALVVVKTNDGRWSKMLLETARQKLNDKRSLPIVVVNRFVTFKEGDERAVAASSKNVYLYAGFRLNLDVGQIVPEEAGGDLRCVVDGDKIHLETLGKAKMYLVTKPLPAAAPTKTAKLVVGETFEARYYNGTFKLHDDGRRSGTLTLKVEQGNELSGSYYSDKDGAKYEVRGHIGTPLNGFEMTIKFPRSEQTFRGWMFTGDARVLVGASKLVERESGFYAVRVEE